ncbi:alpha/beta hydrolase [Kineococcus sp. SYSU DK003]|uniref:alpha/beta hydrolase n=1 Tax=Kineococcus sp. SYSU DK003 TaxID=3383124 RepID=UPI003D7ED696
MDTSHLLDPELVAALEVLPPVQLSLEGLPAMRAEAAAQPRPELPDDVQEREVLVPRPGREPLRLLLTRPVDLPTPAPAVLWIHGGGFVLGSADEDRVETASYARAVGMLVVSVDYGLAPENPHPGPVEDCFTALRWVHDNAAELGVDTARVGVGGGSAGGGLAACLALLARDRGGPPLAFQFLVFPMLDDRTVTTDDPNPVTGEFVWTREANAFGWRCLLGTAPGGPDVSPYAAAARAQDLSGLPPAFLEVGSLDLFLDEDLEYARRLVRAGVPTELHVHPGAFHGYQRALTSTVARTSAQLGTTALRRALQETAWQAPSGRATLTT